MSEFKLTGGHTTSVMCVDAQGPNGFIISGSEAGEMVLWSPTGQVINKITLEDYDCASVLFSKINPNIFYCALGKDINIYDMNTFPEPVYTFNSNIEEVNQIVLDSKERFLAGCDDAGDIRVYDLSDRKVFKTLRFKHTNLCMTLAFREKRPWEILSGGLDSRIIHWDFAKPKCISQFNMGELYPTLGPDMQYSVNPPQVFHIGSSPDSATFAFGLGNGMVPIYDGSKKILQEKFVLLGHSSGCSQVYFDNNNSKLITAGNDSRINFWDLSKAAEYDPETFYMNGDCGGRSNPEEEKRKAITELCKVNSIKREDKINWLKISGEGQERKLFIADSDTDITVMNLHG